jgi:hypothetical protein
MGIGNRRFRHDHTFNQLGIRVLVSQFTELLNRQWGIGAQHAAGRKPDRRLRQGLTRAYDDFRVFHLRISLVVSDGGRSALNYAGWPKRVNFPESAHLRSKP